MPDFNLYSTDKKEFLCSQPPAATSKSTPVKQQVQIPLLFTKPDAKKTGTPNTKSNSVFELSLKKYIKSDAEISHQEDGLAKEIPGWYVLKDDKARQEQLNTHLAKFKTDKEQLNELKRLVSKGVTKEDATLLAGTLEKARSGIVVAASKSIVNINGSKELKTHAGIAVANEIPKIEKSKRYEVLKVVLDTKNKDVQKVAAPKVIYLSAKDQVKGTQAVVATKDVDVINELTKVADKTDKKVQVKVAETLFKTGYEKVQTTLAQIEGKFAKDNQLPIYKMLMKSKHHNVVKTAATNIYTLDKANQATAVKITVETKNAEAIKAAESNYDKYNEEARAEIKQTLSKYNSEHENSNKAPSVREEKIQEKAQAETKANNRTETKTEIKTTAGEQITSNELKEIMNSNEPNKNTLIKEAFKHNPQQAAAWVETLNPYELANIIDAIPLSDLPPDVQNKVSKDMEHADKSAQKRYFEKLNATLMADATIMESCGDNLQKLYTENCLAKGKKLQSTYMLSLGVKRDYDTELKKQNIV